MFKCISTAQAPTKCGSRSWDRSSSSTSITILNLIIFLLLLNIIILNIIIFHPQHHQPPPHLPQHQHHHPFHHPPPSSCTSSSSTMIRSINLLLLLIIIIIHYPPTPPHCLGSLAGIMTSKCASRHNGVQFFISHLASWLRTRRFSKPTFRPSGVPNHWKNTVFRDFPTFSRICIFFLLTLSLLLFFLLIFLFSLPLPCSAFHLSILSEVWLLNFLRLSLLSSLLFYIYIIIMCIYIYMFISLLLIPCVIFWKKTLVMVNTWLYFKSHL